MKAIRETRNIRYPQHASPTVKCRQRRLVPAECQAARSVPLRRLWQPREAAGAPLVWAATHVRRQEGNRSRYFSLKGRRPAWPGWVSARAGQKARTCDIGHSTYVQAKILWICHINMERVISARSRGKSDLRRVTVIGGFTAVVIIGLLFAEPIYSAKIISKPPARAT